MKKKKKKKKYLVIYIYMYTYIRTGSSICTYMPSCECTRAVLYFMCRPPFPRLLTHGHGRPCRRDVGRVFLAGVRPDSPSRRRIPSCYCPGPGRGAAVKMGQRSVHQAHTTPINSVHVSAPCADMFGDSVCA